jgi:hypothetical protein
MSAIHAIDEVVAAKNPLDLAEQIIQERDWLCDRPVEEELVAEVESQWCSLRIWFAWQPDLNALVFSCAYDIKIHERMRTRIHALLVAINERLWLGHFDLGSEDGVIMFRHGILLRGRHAVTSEQFEDLIDIAITECERFYPAFQSVLWGGTTVEDALAGALLDTVGEA